LSEKIILNMHNCYRGIKLKDIGKKFGIDKSERFSRADKSREMLRRIRPSKRKLNQLRES
jgi:hypothetical protein